MHKSMHTWNWGDSSVGKVIVPQAWGPEFRVPEATSKAKHSRVHPITTAPRQEDPRAPWPVGLLNHLRKTR